jgi:hypothetical protein
MLLLASSLAVPFTLRQRSSGDRIFVDSFGRERIFHG